MLLLSAPFLSPPPPLLSPPPFLLLLSLPLSPPLFTPLGLPLPNISYTCQLAGDAYTANFHISHISLLHTVPLEVETDPSDLTVIVGETATFTCAFSGFPAPDRIQWFREGVDDPLTDDKFNITYDDYGLSSQISFMTVLEDHDTAYYCRAMQYLVGGRIENATTGSATLTVNCKLACVQHVRSMWETCGQNVGLKWLPD